LIKGSLYVGTSVWHRDTRAIANQCWKGVECIMNSNSQIILLL
jgi:hypothetical protein